MPALVAFLIAVQAASTPPAPAPAATSPTATSPTAAETAGPTPEGLEELREAFHDSCEVRLYGEYDDMCSSLSDQIRRYRAALARAQRRRPAG